MKKNFCFLLILVLLVTTQSVAQQNSQQLENYAKMEKARKMKSGGATLAVLGGILMIAGGITVRNNIRNGEGNAETGVLCFVFGIGGLASGIPIMAVGAHNQRKYSEQSDGLAVRINITPQSTGLKLSYRF